MFLQHEPTQAPNQNAPILYAGVRSLATPRPASYAIRAQPSGTIQPATPHSLEFFLAERYILYAIRQNTLLSGQVHHTQYPLQTAELLSLDESLLAAAGINRPNHPPLAHFAHGVNVDIFPLRTVLQPSI